MWPTGFPTRCYCRSSLPGRLLPRLPTTLAARAPWGSRTRVRVSRRPWSARRGAARCQPRPLRPHAEELRHRRDALDEPFAADGRASPRLGLAWHRSAGARRRDDPAALPRSLDLTFHLTMHQEPFVTQSMLADHVIHGRAPFALRDQSAILNPAIGAVSGDLAVAARRR